MSISVSISAHPHVRGEQGAFYVPSANNADVDKVVRLAKMAAEMCDAALDAANVVYFSSFADWRLPVSEGGGKSPFHAPSIMQPIIDDADPKASIFGMLSKACDLAIKLKNSVVRQVSRLLFGSSPAAIFRTIPLPPVDPIDGMQVRWPRPHIVKKPVETSSIKRFLEPSVTNRYTLFGVPLRGIIFGIVAPVVHSNPSSVFRGSGNVSHAFNLTLFDRIARRKD